MPCISCPTIITSLPAVCHFLCATSYVDVNVRNPESNSKMLSRICHWPQVLSFKWWPFNPRVLPWPISHSDQGMTCKLAAGYLCCTETCCLNFLGRRDRHSQFPKNIGTQILSYVAPYLTRQNCSVLTAPTSDCPPKELVIRLKEREG